MMNSVFRRTLAIVSLATMLLVAAACNKSKNDSQVNRAQGGPPGGFGPGGPGGMGGPPSPVREIMSKLGRGPQSISSQLDAELKADSPDWEKVQPRAKEYAELAQQVAKYDPPKGSKESWTKLTSEFSVAATALDKAAQAKDKDATLATQKTLSASCTACHQEHRTMGMGMGGMPGKGFGPPGKEGGGFGPPGGKGFGPPGGGKGFGPPGGKGDGPPGG